MSKKPSFLTHYLRFTGADLLGLAAAMISFPIMARYLSYEEFGVLGFFGSISTFVGIVITLSLDESIVRFYPHYAKRGEESRFVSSFVYVPIILSLVIGAVLCLGVVGLNHFVGLDSAEYIVLTVLASTLGAASGCIGYLIYAMERSLLLSIMDVLDDYISTAVVLLTVVFIDASALAVMRADLVLAAIEFAILIIWLGSQFRFRKADVSMESIKESASFSWPLMIDELLGLILGFTDKIMLRLFSGDFVAVGTYTIGAGLGKSVPSVLFDTLDDAVEPVVNRFYENRGPRAVRALKYRLGWLMFYAAAFAGCLVVLIGDEIVAIFAGQDKLASAPVFKVMALSLLVTAVVGNLTFGLTLVKKTKIIMWINISCAVLNAALNVIMIPLYGVMGAVWATVITSFVGTILDVIYCPRELLVGIDRKRLLVGAGLFGFVMIVGLVSAPLWPENTVLRILTGCLLATGLFGLPLHLLEPRLVVLLKRVVTKSKASETSP